MVFSSFTFLGFFLPAVILLYFLSKNINWRNGVLLVFSLFFYAWGEPVWILTMLFSILVNYALGLAIDRSSSTVLRKVFLGIAVTVSVSFLFYFKYSSFFENIFNAIIGSKVVVPPKGLPIGISFFTFHIITYTMDVYRKKTPAQRNPLLLILYVSFFPQLIAGPIVQYGDVAVMLKERTTSLDQFALGMRRFSVGLAKKILLANICGKALSMLPAVSDGLSVIAAWAGMILFALQIYFDFSGYSDMALGMAKSFGFILKENFNYPYASKSISEFWRRWHISLGSFFRDYVYIPLGGNRVGNLRLIFNLAFVWTLTGFWHGASWNFMAWGFYYGVIIILERLVYGKALEKLPSAVRIVYSLVLVLIGWALFYYEDLSMSLKHIEAMFGIGATGAIDPKTLFMLKDKALYLPLALLACVPWKSLFAKLPTPAHGKPLLSANILSSAQYAAAGVLFVLSILALVGQSFNPFLYFRF